MSSSSNTTFLVTGGNRGLGRGLVEQYLARPHHTVIAAVRDPEAATSKALFNLPKGEGSSVILVKIDSSSQTDPEAAVKELQTTYGITTLDVVVANAGISKVFPLVHEINIEEFQEHFNVNVYGIIFLFKAVRPLLNKAKAPKFVTLGTSAASLGDMEKRNFPNANYGTSKAAVNYLTRKIHFENPNLTAFPIDPGWVQTDMGNGGAKAFGLEKAEVSVSDSVNGMTKVIDAATKEETSGKFLFYNGSLQTW
ncbi:hypothetical protein FQN54_006169 [Arachnomyces sp. PD_36]|nr:hypothetical protein FQN54_006169 [Arachnomyces sp. PD_36]